MSGGGQGSGMPSPPPPTLETLPNEVLDEIFQRLDDATLPETPLSKRLLPFQQRARYREINLDRAEQLVLLYHDLVANENPWFRFTTSLQVLCPLVHNELTDEWVLQDPGDLSNEDLIDVLQNLPNVQELLIGGCHRLAQEIFAVEAVTSILPSLVSLDVGLEDDQTNPFLPAFFQHLVFYPNLRKLAIADSGTNAILRPFKPDLPAFSLPVTSLCLWGRLRSRPTVPSIMPLFPHLASIELHDDSACPDRIPVVRAIPYPANLTFVVLVAEDFGFHPDFTDEIALFSSVKHLTMSCGFTSPNKQYWDNLLSLPLETLTFTEKSGIDFHRFTLAVLRHPSLRRIVFDQTEGRRGTRLHYRDGRLHLDQLDELLTQDDDDLEGAAIPTWHVPDWYWSLEVIDEENLSNFRIFLATIEGGKVKVTGSAVKAVEVQDDYDEQYAVLVKYRAARARGEQPTTLAELEAMDEAAKG